MFLQKLGLLIAEVSKKNHQLTEVTLPIWLDKNTLKTILKIIFSIIKETKIQDYLLTLGEIVHVKNIFLDSKLSNNRIWIYWALQTIVEKFTNDHVSLIEINIIMVQARRYVTHAGRIILYIICPTIPNDVLNSKF